MVPVGSPSGFNAVPSGYSNASITEHFGSSSYWWSYDAGTDGDFRYMDYYRTQLLTLNTPLPAISFYQVRCIKD